MANQPHPDRKAVTWRLHRDLVSAVQLAAAANHETVLSFVTRALDRELAALAVAVVAEPTGTGSELAAEGEATS